MKAAFLQFEPKYLRVQQNLDTVASLIAGADADLIVLPELFTSGYFFHSTADVARVAELIPEGPTVQRLIAWASDLGAVIVAGMPEMAGGQFYNSAVIVGPEGFIGAYRKVHLYFEEKLHFTPGNYGFPVFDLADRNGTPYRLGVMVCFDWYYPESARTLTLSGADVIAHPANLVRRDCPRAMPVRALENHVYTITANRTGSEEKDEKVLTFIGQSLICDPNGDVLASAERTETKLGMAEINPEMARNRLLTPHNDLLNDRRPVFYG